MGKQGKRVTVTVDIAAQATQFNNIIEQSKKSLSSLSLSPQIDSKKLKEFQSLLDKMQKDAGELQTRLATGLSTSGSFDKAGKDIQGLFQRYTSFVKNVESLGIDVSKILPNTQEVEKILTKISTSTEKRSELIGKKFGKGLDKGLDKAMSEAAGRGDSAEIKRLEKEAKAANTAANRSNISKAAAVGKKYGTDAAGASAAIQKELEAYRRMSETDQRAYRGKTGRTIETMKGDLATAKKYDTYKQGQSNISAASGQYQAQASEIQQLTTAIDQLTMKLQQLAGPSQDAAKQGLDQIAQSADQVEQETNQMNDALNKGGDSFDNMSKKAGQMSQLKSYIGYMFSITSIFMRLGQAVRGAINDFKALDKQFNQISIVTGKTMDELWNGFSNLNYVAKQYGVVTSDVVATQKLYYQQGRSAAEVTQLTGETLTLAKISGIEFADATEYMTAAINAYNIAATEAVRITDTYSALSTEAAVDAKEVAVAMSKVASLASMSGSGFEDTSAYLTKIIETTREAPETAGTALKTVIARFTEIKKLTQDQKELLDEDYNFNNIEKALKSVGVQVKDSQGQMRDFSAILNDLGPLWDELDSNTQHYIATQAAGARQQSRFIALMNDWSRTEELIGVAEDSAGTGAKQLALAMDSIETKTNQLKSAWETFYTEFLNSDMVKNFIGLITQLLEALTDIASIPAIGPWIIVGVTAAMWGLVNKAKVWGKAFGEAFTKARNATEEKLRKAKDTKDQADAAQKGSVEGAAEGTAHGTAEASAEETAEQTKHAIDMTQAAKDGAAEGTVEGTAHGLAEALGQYTAKAKAKFTQGWQKSSGKIKGAGAKVFGKGGAKAAGGAATGAGAKVGAGAAIKAAGGKAITAIGAAAPYALIVAAVIAALWAGFKLAEKARANQEKKLLKNIEDSQVKIDEAVKNIRETSNNYIEALDLQRKGLSRTTEEAEKYQETLKSLKEIYPNLVNTLSDGTLELADNAEYLYTDLMETERETIRKEYDNIQKQLNSTKAAASAGVVFSEAGRAIQQGIKEATANLSEKDDDYIKKVLGLSGLEGKNLTQLQEKGLTRQSLNAAVNERAGWYAWGDWDMSQAGYLKMLKNIAGGGTGGAGRGQEYELIKYYAQQMGKSVEEMAEQLIKEADGTTARVEEAASLTASYAAQAGAKVSTYIDKAIRKLAEDEDNKEKIEDQSKAYYLSNTKEERERFEKYLDNMYSETNISEALEVSADQFGITGAGDLVSGALEEQKNNIKDALTGSSGLFETYRQLIQNNLSNDDLFVHFGDMTVSQTASLLEQIKKVAKDGGPIAAREFEESYRKYANTIDYSDTLKAQFLNIDTTNIAEVSAYAAEMAVRFGEDSNEYQGFVDLVNKSSNVLSRTFRTYNEIISGTKNEVEKFSDSLDNLGNALKGSLDATGLLEILEEFQGILSPTDFSATSEGFKFVDIKTEEEALKLANQLLDVKRLQMQYEQQINTLKLQALQAELQTESNILISEQQDYIKYQKMILTKQELSTDEKKQYLQIQEKINGLEKASLIANVQNQLSISQSNDLLKEMDVIWEQIYIQSVKANHPITKQIEQLEKLISLLSNIEEYMDIDAYMDNLNLKLSHYEFTIEFSTNIDTIVDNTKKRIDTVNNLINANLSKAQRATENAATYRVDLEKNASQAVSFDIEGNLLTNDEWFRKEAERISKITDKDQQEKEEKIYDTLLKKIEAYRKEHKLIQESTNEAEKNLKVQKDILKSLRENVVALEDKFLELFIKRDEKALESLEKRYEAMKQADQDYLDSVRDAVEEERRLRDRDKSASDLEKMERQLELLKMSGGSATAIQELEQKIADARQDMNDTAVDDMLDSIEKENESRAKSYDDEVEYQRAVLEAKKENQIAYNAEIAALMSQDKETIMNTWKALDDEYKRSSDTNKILLETSMNEMVTNGKSALILLKDEGVLIVDGAMDELAGSTKDAEQAMKDYAKTVSDKSNGAVKSLQTLGKEYYNVRDSVQAVLDVQNQLNDAIDKYNGLDIKPPEKEDENPEVLPENFDNWEAYYKYLDQHPTQGSEFTSGSSKETNRIASYTNSVKDVEGDTWYEVEGYWYRPRDIVKATNKVVEIRSGATGYKNDEMRNIFLDFIDANGLGGKENDPGANTGTQEYFDTRVRLKDGGSIDADIRAENRNGKTGYTEVEDLLAHGAYIDRAEGNKVLLKPTKGAFWLDDDRGWMLDNYWGELWVDREQFLKHFTWGPKYETGGIVDYTGPAWVDGTKSKPEAFLSAKDTVLIAGLRDVLRANASFGNLSNTSVQKTGDVYYEIHINVDELGEGYSVDDLVDEMEERILQATGKNSVIKIT